MGRNVSITMGLCENSSLSNVPFRPNSRRRHFEPRFDALEGKVVHLLVEYCKTLGIGRESI